VFYLNVARAFAIAFQVFLSVFANVSDICFKCFICFYTYITNVSSDSFKSGSDVAVRDPPTAASVQTREVEGGVSNLCVRSRGTGTVQTSAGNVRPGTGPHLGAQNRCVLMRASVRALALP
jgi:hypothetical protein